MAVSSMHGPTLSVGWYWDECTVFGQAYLVCYQPPRPTQPSALCGMGDKDWPKCGDALWLGIKGRMATSIKCMG